MSLATVMVIVTWQGDISLLVYIYIYIYIYIRSLVSLVFFGLTCRIYAGSSSLFGVYCMRQRIF